MLPAVPAKKTTSIPLDDRGADLLQRRRAAFDRPAGEQPDTDAAVIGPRAHRDRPAIEASGASPLLAAERAGVDLVHVAELQLAGELGHARIERLLRVGDQAGCAEDGHAALAHVAVHDAESRLVDLLGVDRAAQATD